jgi:hypothetical protein
MENPKENQVREAEPVRLEDIRPEMTGDQKQRALEEILRVLRGEKE